MSVAGDIKYNRSTSGTPLDVVGGRLDLVSATSLKWAFTNSAQIRLNNGSSWEIVTPSSEPTLANTGLDLNSTALAPNTIYDIFAEYSSSTAFNLVASRWATGGDGANNAGTTSCVPLMTAANAPGPVVVTTGSVYTTNYGWCAFDGSGTTDWLIFTDPSAAAQSLMIDFGNPVCINKYYLISAYRANNATDAINGHPKDWKLQGTNNTSAAYGDAINANGWTDLGTETGKTASAVSQTSSAYTCINSQSYRYYRLRVTASGNNGAVNLSGLTLVASANSLAGGSSRVRAYEASVIYNAGDRVTYGGHDWVCILQTTAGTTPVAGNYWVDNGTSVSGDFAGLYRHDGVLVSDSSSTGKKRRWLGIIYTYNNGGTVNFKDDVNYRYVSNYYNRKSKTVKSYNTNDTWTYASNVVRESNSGSGQVRGMFICSNAISTHISRAACCGMVVSNMSLSVCLNTPSTALAIIYVSPPAINTWTSASLSVNAQPVVGLNYITECEANASNAGNTVMLGGTYNTSSILTGEF